MDKKESRVLATFNNIWLYWQKSNLLSANFFQIVVSKDFFLSGKHLSLITLQDRVNTCYVHIRKCFKSQKMCFSNNFTTSITGRVQTKYFCYASTYILSQINSNFQSQTFRNQFCGALEQQNHMALWDNPKSKITCFCVLYSNTVIKLLNSIPRFLVCWLGPWPVNWMSPVQILLKSLVAYILLKFLKNGCFCFSIIPLWIHNIGFRSFLKLYSDFLGSQI